MANIEEFPKFQYSEFIKTSTQDGQYVVRADTLEEFKTNLHAMRVELGLEGEKLGATNNHVELDEPPAPDDEEKNYCYMHTVAMTKGFSKTKRDANNNPKAYWFHKEDGKMCFGRGWK